VLVVSLFANRTEEEADELIGGKEIALISTRLPSFLCYLL